MDQRQILIGLWIVSLVILTGLLGFVIIMQPIGESVVGEQEEQNQEEQNLVEEEQEENEALAINNLRLHRDAVSNGDVSLCDQILGVGYGFGLTDELIYISQEQATEWCKRDAEAGFIISGEFEELIKWKLDDDTTPQVEFACTPRFPVYGGSGISLSEVYSQECYDKKTKEACDAVDVYDATTSNFGNADGIPDCQWISA